MTSTNDLSQPIQVGMNARLFPSNWRPARDEIAFAAANNFAFLQFPGEHDGLGAARLGESPEVVGQLLEAAGVGAVMEIVVLVDAAGHTAAGSTPLEVLRANLPAIDALRCTCVHLHLAPRERAPEGAYQALEQQLAPQFAEGVSLAVAHNFRFGFEHNEPDIGMFPTPERCAALLEAVPGIGLVWDINHTTPTQLPGYLGLVPRMTMLHISDTPLPTVNYHYPLGMGSIDIAAYCQALIKGGFNGPAILEIGGLPKSGGFGRDTDEALVDSARRLREAALVG